MATLTSNETREFLVEKILKSLVNPKTLEMIDDDFVKNTLKIICSIMGDIDTSKKNEKTDEIYQMCENIIYIFANLKTKVGQNNCLFFLMIVQKLIDQPTVQELSAPSQAGRSGLRVGEIVSS